MDSCGSCVGCFPTWEIQMFPMTPGRWKKKKSNLIYKRSSCNHFQIPCFYLTQQYASLHIRCLFKNNIFPTVKIASPPMIFTQRETSSSSIMGSYTTVFSSQANLIVARGATVAPSARQDRQEFHFGRDLRSCSLYLLGHTVRYILLNFRLTAHTFSPTAVLSVSAPDSQPGNHLQASLISAVYNTCL